MGPFEIRTKRMVIRPLNDGDRAEHVHAAAASDAFWKRWSPGVGAEEDPSFEARFERFVHRAEKDLASGDGVRLAGFCHDGRLAGFFALNSIVRGAFQNAYIGWSVNVEVARQGYGTEGVTAMLNLAFAPEAAGGVGLHRVQANIIPANAPSIALAEKLGFRREGLALRYLKIDGRWQDHIMFARTVEEHEAKRVGTADERG